MLQDWRAGTARCATTCDLCPGVIQAGEPVSVHIADPADIALISCRRCAVQRWRLPVGDYPTGRRSKATGDPRRSAT